MNLIKKYKVNLLGALLLMFISFYNQYPLVSSDSGTYINSAFGLYMPKDRPIFYGLFILCTSLKLTLWFVILAQSLILSWLINEFITLFFPFISNKYKLLILISVVLFTSVSWFTVQIMPDIFTSMMCLSTILLLFTNNPSKKKFLFFILLLSIVVHNANLSTITLFFLILLLYTLISKKRLIAIKKIKQLFTIIATSWLLVCGSNYCAGYGFTVNPSSHIFFMGKMVENGILKRYLNEYCDQHRYALCTYKDSLPKYAWDFIWDNNGVFSKTGGWNNSKEEYTSIIKNTLTNIKYLRWHIKESISASIAQIQLTQIDEGLRPYLDNTNPYWKVSAYFTNDFKMYLHSKQNTSKLKFTLHNKIIRYAAVVYLMIGVCLLWLNKNLLNNILFVLISTFCILNAFTTATLANVTARLNARCIWLLVFFCICLIVDFFQKKYKKRVYSNIT